MLTDERSLSYVPLMLFPLPHTETSTAPSIVGVTTGETGGTRHRQIRTPEYVAYSVPRKPAPLSDSSNTLTPVRRTERMTRLFARFRADMLLGGARFVT
ncbi:hypothetical protein JOC54_004157 [Alkalihalobacillus xiaoxiensis]|uniref:Uncharacterized protein n=1 Tax=Shouchella xiaoxiensis TaxID=766895 RepID=A0ABS2T2F0_9BACI|nr:hypothetical protein [Shouchella xiaoxiensis]